MSVLPFVDQERLVVRHAKAFDSTLRVVTDLPTPLESGLPLIQVIAAAGTADGQVTAYPRVDLYCFAATRSAVWSLTARSVELMRSLAAAEVDGQGIDAVNVMMRPYFLAWSPTVPRTIGTYEIQLRPRPATG